MPGFAKGNRSSAVIPFNRLINEENRVLKLCSKVILRPIFIDRILVLALYASFFQVPPSLHERPVHVSREGDVYFFNSQERTFYIEGRKPDDGYEDD